MKRLFVMLVPAAFVVWWWQRAPAPTTAPDETRTAHVLVDLAKHTGDLRWDVSHDDLGTNHGLELRTIQHKHASIDLWYGRATVETPNWRITILLERVTDIVCEREFMEPDTVFLNMSFRNGPDEIGERHELFTVRFEQDREDDFRAICDRYQLRRDGW